MLFYQLHLCLGKDAAIGMVTGSTESALDELVQIRLAGLEVQSGAAPPEPAALDMVPHCAGRDAVFFRHILYVNK